MAKFYGNAVKTGRVGASVFRINRGVTVESQYQPNVANPSTPPQVEQRAKMKLASQVAAALANEVKPFGRDKMASSRNLFIRDLFNREAISYSNSTATLDTAQVRLTTSRLDMITGLSVTGIQDGASVVGRVTPDYVGRVMGIRIVALKAHEVPGSDPDIIVSNNMTVVPVDGAFSATLTFRRQEAATVLAYAYIPENEAAVLRYENIMAGTGDAVVSLETVRKEMASGLIYSLTYVQKVLAQ